MSLPTDLPTSGDIDGIPVAFIPLLLDGFETFVQFRGATYLSIASLTFLLYDHLLTLGDEVEYIWKAPSNITKWLFLFNRYLVPLSISISMRAFSGIQAGPLTDSVCKIWTAVSFSISPLAIANGSFIILLRLWNLWDRHTGLVLSTLAAFVIAQILTFALTIRVAVIGYHEIQYLPFTQSCVFPHKIDLVSLYAPSVGFEVIVFALTWWNALSRPRTSDRAMARQLYWNGSLVFFFLFVMRVLNMVLAALAPLGLTFLGLFFVWASTTSVVSHLVLNLRRTAVQQAREAEALAAQYEYKGDEATVDAVRAYHTPTPSGSVRSQDLGMLQSGWGTSHEGAYVESYELSDKALP